MACVPGASGSNLVNKSRGETLFQVRNQLSRILVNRGMQEERARYLQAGEYERTEDWEGNANGYKPKTVKTRLGEITSSVPQVREGGFYPSAQEKRSLSERAFTMTLAKMDACTLPQAQECRAYPPAK